ncbi:uncharacterized protein LOC131207627 [Anopheles bellator]|uniref:uncharacterized protein LOC131207627 n=1 Tax=Anopheles bellator TaxID=139047 RepID=UPI00264A2BDB|nr:uncharacterized protein LOC131207627 [Anopheles bellator]
MQTKRQQLVILRQSGGNSQHSCNCGKTAGRSKGGNAHHSHSHHQAHSTISSNIRKELASYENPYQSQGANSACEIKSKRNASTESLDLFDKFASEEDCTCALYSPSFLKEGKCCKKCRTSDRRTAAYKTRAAGTNGTGQKKYNSSKFKDASTSPKSNSPLKVSAQECRSPKIEASTDTKFDFNCSPKTSSHYRRLSSLSINGASKTVATSPMNTPSPGISPQKLSPMKGTLEKSNSLGDSKPSRLLRNTRSLSPRPPMRHQHSIMVSDENDIISVKLSPNQDFEDESLKLSMPPATAGGGCEARVKDQFDESSSIVDVGVVNSEGTLKLGDCSKSALSNRSTSCLVYVPSDPWTRMSTSTIASPPSVKQQKSKTLDNSCKAYGKPCLESIKNSDPWVWRSNVHLSEAPTSKGGRKRHVLPHQAKSLTMGTVSHDDSNIGSKLRSAKLCQQQSLGRFEKTLTIPGVDGSFDARKKITRPKLQRSKSPAFYEDFFQHLQTGQDTNKCPVNGGHSLVKNKSVSSLKMEKNASNSNLNGHGHSAGSSLHHMNHSNNNNSSSSNSNSVSSYSSYNDNGSPTSKRHPSPKLTILAASTQQPHPSPSRQLSMGQQEMSIKASLNLLNPNMLQPRHSFSTPSQKDDELQLNIRRLSEQMNKYSHSSAAPAFLNETIAQQKAKTGGVCGSSLTSGLGSGSNVVVEPTVASTQRKTASHSKINEPILETRC